MVEYDIGSKLRELRLTRDLTLREVAREIGFSIALLSQIEKNNISPPIATLSKLARFFNVKMSSLFAEKDEERKFGIIRKNDRRVVSHVVSSAGNGHGYSYESFSARMRTKKMVPFLITLSEGIHDGTTYSHEGESFVFVLQGTLSMLLDQREIILEEGDSIYFDTSLEHRFRTGAGGEAQILEVTAGRP
jgi:transcriptional regulator with XRE-family HTH domain